VRNLRFLAISFLKMTNVKTAFLLFDV